MTISMVRTVSLCSMKKNLKMKKWKLICYTWISWPRPKPDANYPYWRMFDAMHDPSFYSTCDRKSNFNKLCSCNRLQTCYSAHAKARWKFLAENQGESSEFGGDWFCFLGCDKVRLWWVAQGLRIVHFSGFADREAIFARTDITVILNCRPCMRFPNFLCCMVVLWRTALARRVCKRQLSSTK